MIGILGLIVGMYVLTRMIELLDGRNIKGKNLGVAGVFAILTMLATICAMIYFILGPDLALGLLR
jgi:hypothetical protein